MGKPVALNKQQEVLLKQLKDAYKNVWDIIDKDITSIKHNNCHDAIVKMGDIAHSLHMSLLASGHEPIHHKYMIENRGIDSKNKDFYKHVHPVKDLLAFIADEDANNDPVDITLDKEFYMDVFTRRWGHYDRYKFTRNERGWHIQFLSNDIQANKDVKPDLNQMLDHDSVCYPEQINTFFEYLWNKAHDEGLSEAEVQRALNDLGEWISQCERYAPRGIFGGLM